MKTTAGQALRFAACARAPMRQARYAGTALNHGAAAREGHRASARRPDRFRSWRAPPASLGHGYASSWRLSDFRVPWRGATSVVSGITAYCLGT